MKINALIVDDESLGRSALLEHCLRHDEIQVVGECESGAEALQSVAALRPDLLFLDVHMKPISGIEVAAQLSSEFKPLIVFVTAYDQFAIDAFEVNAIDYLLKPIDADRFDAAIVRAGQRVDAGLSSTQRDALQRMIVNAIRAEPRRIVIESEGKVVFVDPRSIEYIEADRNYVSIKVGEHTHSVRSTIGELESRLPGNQFLRLHRSIIVNVARIRAMERNFHGEFAVEMESRRKFTSGRSYRQRLQSFVLRSRGVRNTD